ncbi:flavoprotein [Nocardia goodfellowii]|uniref:Phosphopantothenoylcysteine synthetase/decarboxylase n=1 Tax=Nocardia goodfellowii TaxID=882446 RepID=A0ABS4Q8A8_9NOCA|nr:flavoprotein [Nocardia goodfellowii]MBP2187926.1 phosphopantothenoylcysteine synthetase/decarboxylase [Nocardia goodfellowii]
MSEHRRPVLYAIATGASAARDIGKLVDIAQAAEWEVCVVTSPAGRRFIDVAELEGKSGYPVRSEYKEPGTPDLLPAADAMIVAPITANSLAKWAAGISDTLPLGLLVEGLGKGLPVVAVPFSNRAQLEFPAIQEAIRRLAEWGVIVVGGADIDEPHEPGEGARHIPRFPWARTWQALLTHPRYRRPE